MSSCTLQGPPRAWLLGPVVLGLKQALQVEGIPSPIHLHAAGPPRPIDRSPKLGAGARLALMLTQAVLAQTPAPRRARLKDTQGAGSGRGAYVRRPPAPCSPRAAASKRHDRSHGSPKPAA